MNNLSMKKYGIILTDRTFGKDIALKILDRESFPVSLDFREVMTLGSSFGDELMSAIQKKQTHVQIRNANRAIRSCLEKVAFDFGIKLQFDN